MQKQRYIEFIGLPGSGKTEAARALCSYATTVGVTCELRKPIGSRIFYKIQIIIGTLLFCIRHPNVLVLWSGSIEEEYQNTPHITSVVANVRWRLLVEVILVRSMLRRPEHTFINDEGITGKVVVLSLLIGIDTTTMHKLLSVMLPQSTEIVHIDPPHDIAITRVMERPTELPFFEEMESNLRLQFYERNRERYASVVQWLHAERGAVTARISNAGSRDALGEEVHGIGTILF